MPYTTLHSKMILVQTILQHVTGPQCHSSLYLSPLLDVSTPRDYVSRPQYDESSHHLEGLEKIDQELCNKTNFYEDVDELIDTAFPCITAACNTAFKVSRGVKHLIKKTTVSWWTEELTVLRKRTNALRRRYQRTTNNENLRQEGKKIL